VTCGNGGVIAPEDWHIS